MESLFLLIPLSVGLVLLIGGVLTWAVKSGKFENLKGEGRRVPDDRDPPD
ncbi:MAG TPA: cbb3-type cytochrome oxidase assembly protein CcoS [Burkholderiaceae bacterium]|jgi:cbb3-type cytochrome oxidase maturation protein|nr:cbb3-type cytochrome oxidase assembly protein CcoS [Burkholderiaceae bacterium]